MKRRDIIAGLVLAGVSSAAKEHETKSLYIPKAQLIEDRTFLHEFMDECSFVDLLTGSPQVRIRHIPVLLDRSAGKYGKLSATSLARILKVVHSMASITP